MIGRDEEKQTVARLLTDNRFATIYGPGGMGKTSLALALANTNPDAFRDGVFFIDLGTSQSANSPSDMLASTLGLTIRSDNPASNIVEFVRSRKLLIVFDCCEHVVDQVASLSEVLLQHAAGVSVLATSREPLRALGEHVFPLPPLASPPVDFNDGIASLLAYPAARLFGIRAASAGYRADLTDDDAPFVAEICRRSGGIPLAIELAASRAGVHGLKQTADQMSSDAGLSWNGRRTALPRHKTLGAMIDWSYALIEERSRSVLQRLSVLVGNFSAEEAQSVAADDVSPAELLEILDALVLKSLVTVDHNKSEARYRLLDMVRTFARAQLRNTGGEAVACRRHAEFHLQLCMNVPIAPSRAEALERIKNVRAALQWALADRGDIDLGIRLAAHSQELFLKSKLIAEARRWAKMALPQLPREYRSTRIEMLIRAGLGQAKMLTVGDTVEVENHLEQALSLAELLEDRAHELSLLNAMHMHFRRMGAFDKLLPIASKAQAVADRLDRSAPRFVANAMLGVTHHLLGNLGQAAHTLSALAYLPRAEGEDPDFFGFYHDAEVLLARTLWLQGFADQAAENARMVGIDEDWADPVTSCLRLIWSGSALHLSGQWDEAELRIVRVERIASEHSLEPYKWFCLASRGDLERMRGNPQAGLEMLRDALGYFRVARYNTNLPWLMSVMAEALQAMGKIDQALSVINSFQEGTGSGPDWYTAEFLRIRGDVYAAAGDAVLAQEIYHRSLSIADAQGALSWRLRTARSLSRLLFQLGRRTDALEYLEGTLQRFSEGFQTRDFESARAQIETFRS